MAWRADLLVSMGMLVHALDHPDIRVAERGVTLLQVGINERPLALLQRSPAHAGLRDRIHPDREQALR